MNGIIVFILIQTFIFVFWLYLLTKRLHRFEDKHNELQRMFSNVKYDTIMQLKYHREWHDSHKARLDIGRNAFRKIRERLNKLEQINGQTKES